MAGFQPGAIPFFILDRPVNGPDKKEVVKFGLL